MITLITGQPGAGKTLRTLFEVNQLAQKEGRAVYYSGINDLKLPWIELEKADEWHKCPVGSIIVIDECQRVFRPRGNGAAVPECVAKFETHRHQGLDVFLITQHPMLLDSNVRRLCGRHVHVMRAFGAKAANLHEWGEVKEYCDKSRNGSVETFWKYPAEVFGYYKSAELHTHKFRLPPRVLFLLLMPILIAACVWMLYRWWEPRLTGEDHKNRVEQSVTANGAGGAVGGSVPAGVRKTAEDYLAEISPRVPGLLHTAAAYDGITAPKEAPIPMCYTSSKSGCRCVDQQGNRYATTDETCRYLVKNGMFIAWKESGQAMPAGHGKAVAVQKEQPIGG